MSVPIAGRSGPPLFTVAVFWAFVLGGLAFGGIFLANWRTLGTRAAERPPGAPPNVVTVGAGPVSVKVPMSINPGPISAPPKPAEITSSIAAVVKTVLPDWQGTDRVNILLLGIDKRDDEPIAGTRSDTIMLASIDPVTKSAALVSIPRDMWVRIPGCTPREGCSGGQQRINVAHAVGGPELAVQTVTTDFGLPIQFYARVDFRGFEQLIDAVGGVVIDDRDRIANLVIDTSYANPFRGPDGADLLQPNIPAIKHAIESAQRSAAHPELRAKIEVLNGSGTAGVGQKAADYLTAQGFNVVRIAAAERSDYRSSLVQVLTEDKGAAEALATTLRMPTTAISQVPTPHAEADIRIVVGQDFRVPPTS